MQERIEDVIERCRERIALSLDCRIEDILRLCDEVERQQPSRVTQNPPWHGLGSGD
jgi:hypothetical protein